MDKATVVLAPKKYPRFFENFLVGLAVGFAVRYSHALLTAFQFLALQILFLCFVKQPDRSTGEPLVTDMFNAVKIMGMWTGWALFSLVR